MGQRSFAVNIPTPWNSLPPALRSPDLSQNAFKKASKTICSQPHGTTGTVSVILAPDINTLTYLLSYLLNLARYFFIILHLFFLWNMGTAFAPSHFWCRHLFIAEGADIICCSPRPVAYTESCAHNTFRQTVESISVVPPRLSDHSQIVSALAKRLLYPGVMTITIGVFNLPQPSRNSDTA